MGESVRLERDPVCGMMVDEWARQVVHRGLGYAFCSQQCRERFIATPEIYVGRRGSLAPKQRGMEVIRHQRMALGLPLTQTEFFELKSALSSMMGVISVRSVCGIVEGRPDAQHTASRTQMPIRIEAMEISYDLLQATAEQLERRCAELKVVPSRRWGEKLLRDFIYYLEKCELEDLQSRAAVLQGGDGHEVRTAAKFRGAARSRADYGRRDMGG